MMVLGTTKKPEQRSLLERGLWAMGIRLNRDPPNIYLKQTDESGTKMIYNIPRDYKILNAEVLVRDENCTVGGFIDVIIAPHRRYIRCLYVYNKIDRIPPSYPNTPAMEPHTVVMSCELHLGTSEPRTRPGRAEPAEDIRNEKGLRRTLRRR